MDIQWFRDLVICIFGLVATGVLIFSAVLFYSFYRRAGSILTSIETASRTIEEVMTYIVDEVIKPLSQVIALVGGIRQGVTTVVRLFTRKEGGEDG